MTTTKSNQLTIRILDRNYQIKCPPEKMAELQEAAGYLDGKMRELIENGRAYGIDRVAVIAALNVTHELLNQKKHNSTYIDQMHQRLLALQDTVESALTD